MYPFSARGALIMDTQSQNKFFDLWSENIDFSGNINKIMAAGPMREKTEKMMTGFPLFLNLYSMWIDSILDFQNLSFEVINKMHEKMVNIDYVVSPEKNKELYNIFIETCSDTFKDFMKTEHFAGDMGKFISGLIDLKKYNRDMLEENFLNPLDIPTRTEVDELAREMYALKKKVRELARKIEEQ